MKNILFLLLLFPVLSFGLKDTIKSSGLWSVLTWSTGASPTTSDTVYKVGGPYNDTMDADYTVVAFVCIATTGGTHWRNGRTLTVTGNLGYVDDGTGTRDMGTGLTANGASATVHFGSTLGTVTATSCVITMNTATAGILDIDKACTIDHLVNNGVLVNGGSAVFRTTSAGPALILANSASYTCTSIAIYTRTTSGDIFTIGTLVTYAGAGDQYYQVGANSLTITVPALTYTGTGIIKYQDVGGQTGWTIQLTGHQNYGTARVDFYTPLTGSNGTFDFNAKNLTCGSLNFGNLVAGSTLNYNFSSGTFNILAFNNFVTYNAGTTNLNFQTSLWSCSGIWIFPSTETITHTSDIVNLNGTGAQLVTLNGKQGYDWTVANTGTATVKFLDSLSLLGDLILSDGRDSLGRVDCIDYTNTTNDSVFHTDTTIIRGSYYRNNAKVSRVGGKISFRGTVNGTINLVDAGTMGPVSIRKTAGSKMTASSAIRSGRVLDSTGALKMGVYALACTTLTVSDTGLQCAAVTLDTLNAYKGGTIGGGTITRWNWLADDLRYILVAATKTVVGSNSGFGGTAIPWKIDSVICATLEGMDTLSCPQDTPAYAYTLGQYMVNNRYLPATSVSGGNNRNVKTLSYTGVTKDTATGSVGTPVIFTGPGFVGPCWIKFGSDSSALTVASYTSASKAVPTLAAGVYAVSVGNSDEDVATVGDFTVGAAPSTTTRKQPYGYGYKKYCY